MNKRIVGVLNEILSRFKTDDIPEPVVYSSYPIISVPASKWSFLNRTIMFMHGTGDARGFRQWLTVDRHVKKGARALYILVPMICRKENEDGEEAPFLTGFAAAPVFRAEDTEGAPLD